MTQTADSEKLNRRALLAGAVFLLGGGAALLRFGRQSESGGAKGPSLSSDQFALLEQISDTMIPETDTPGAVGADVPAFIGQMLMQWGSSASFAEVVSTLEAMEQQSWSTFGSPFIELPAQRRLAILKDFDTARIAAKDGAYRKLKWLILIGYYHSEVGATQELRFELVPGAWRACLPLSEVGRATAVQ